MTSLPVPAEFETPSHDPLPPHRGEKPVPTFSDGADRKARFLERLSLSGNVRSACRAIAITPMTAYRWRRACKHFASGWEAALVVARAAAEEVLADRALNGVEETVYYHGEEVATRTRYDTRLLLAHLARLDAKAEDRNIAEAAEDFDAAIAHFETHGTMPPPRAEAAQDAESSCGNAGAPAFPPDQPWLDESMPFVERLHLYLGQGDGDEEVYDDTCEDAYAGEGDSDEGGKDIPSWTV